MIATAAQVTALLDANPSFKTWVPYIQGLTFQDSVVQKEKVLEQFKWLVVASMEKCEAANGNEYAMDVWSLVARGLATARWNMGGKAIYGPRGGLKIKWNFAPVALWRKIYRQASLKVSKDRPTSIHKVLDEAVEDILQKRRVGA